MKLALPEVKLHVLRLKIQMVELLHRLLFCLRESFVIYIWEHSEGFCNLRNKLRIVLSRNFDIFVSAFDNQQSQIVFTKTEVFVIVV